MRLNKSLTLIGAVSLVVLGGIAAVPIISSISKTAVATPVHGQGWESQLNLTDAQKAQIRQIHESAEQQIDAIYSPDQKAQLQQARQQHQRPNLNLSDDQKAKIKAIRQNTESQVQAILTPEQQQQLQQLHQQRRQNHQQQ